MDQLQIQPRWGKHNTRHQMSSKRSKSSSGLVYTSEQLCINQRHQNVHNSYKMLTEDQLSIESFILKLNALSDCGSSLRWYPLFLNSCNPLPIFPLHATMPHHQVMHVVISYNLCINLPIFY